MSGMPQSFCKYDIPHIGALFRQIRQSRGVGASDLVEWCGIPSQATISRFEQDGKMSPKNFDRYLRAFESTAVCDPPLAQHQIRALQFLYDERGEADIQRRQCQLAAIGLQDICASQRPPALAEMVERLATTGYPAMIMDNLWFIHAINENLLQLYGVHEENLYRWEAWHSVAGKIPTDLPIRHAQVTPDQFLPQSFVLFFEHENTFPYLFTVQMRRLICQMLTLSEDYNHSLHQWWRQITAFLLPFNLDSIPRRIGTQGHHKRMDPGIALSRTVEIHKGYPVQYHLVSWYELDTGDKKIPDVAPLHPQRVFFAADFDLHGNFHVNTWGDVNVELRRLVGEGACY